MNEQYLDYVNQRAKRSVTLRNGLFAFLSGGAVCCIGEGFFDLWSMCLSEDYARTAASVTLIFIAQLLTALGCFDKLSKYCGGGLLVPITGFANAMAAAAIDNKSEGFITGVGAKMFIIAGPVIVYGTLLSFLYGIVYCIFTVL